MKNKRKGKPDNVREKLQKFDKEGHGKLCQRQMKLALYSEWHLSQAEIDVLIEYLGKDNSGYFAIENFES